MPSSNDLVPLSAHVKPAPAGARHVGEVDPQELVHVTVRVRPHTTAEQTVRVLAAQPPGQRRHLSRQEFADQHGGRAVDIDKVEEYARQNGLKVRESSSALRSVHLEGTAEAMSRAFGVTMKKYERDGQTFRIRTDTVKIPRELTGIVEAIVGFDTRPHARPHIRFGEKTKSGKQPHAAGNSFTPLQLADLYKFPAADGAGEVIGIIELMMPLGSGFRPTELKTYFTSLNLPTPEVVVVSVDGGQNEPGTDPSDEQCGDGEVMLDIEVAGAVAPKAKIVVYFAPNTARGFLDVINQAVHDSVNNPSVISLSWGGAEDGSDLTTAQINQILQAAAAMGVTFCVASGDSGSRDNPQDPTHAAVDFPASSPFALGCGGTLLKAAGTTILSETVWHEPNGAGSGGGVSRVFDLPDYQQNADVPPSTNPPGRVARGVPDVAGDGARASGYQILVDDFQMTIGGTSAVAPLWAGLVARLNQKLGHKVGFLNPFLYAHPNVCNDITQGNNGDYPARPGWDPCTGLGSPDGTKLLNALTTPVAVATIGS
jgi:kumamolisin